ncbi:hypothetical protein EUX98_g9395 [Antrodiella citrinella]|uniref:Uncharacterized protein n=1 Tax=Antrodiella citrinella TaxID=2447956 RepID=A0A4S4LTT5_9APHY|nr:hypothetical protein EUX98_g9395 [Antrodiella citrinella]
MRTRSQLSGAQQCLEEAAAEVDELSIQAEQEDAIEFLTGSITHGIMEDTAADDDDEENETNTESGEHVAKKARHEKYSKNLGTASGDTLVKKTRDEYARLYEQFAEFCVEVGYVKKASDIEEFVLKRRVPAEVPTWVAVWVMDKGDEINIETGLPKQDVPFVKYATAQKWRAAVSHQFGRLWGLGTQLWMENPLRPGTYLGNPCLSPVVSQYMVRAGRDVTSAQAVNESNMKALSEYNKNVPRDEEITAGSHKEPDNWGGWRVRVMLNAIYTISMLCLLRFGEVLNLMWEDVKLETLDDGRVRLEIRLLVRKTHQTGDIAPFYLYRNTERPWMCAVSALSEWWRLTRKLGLGTAGPTVLFLNVFATICAI